MWRRSQIMIVSLWVRLYFVKVQTQIVTQSPPVLQTGIWSCQSHSDCSRLQVDCNNYLNKFYISFDQPFTEIPMVGSIVNQYEHPGAVYDITLFIQIYVINENTFQLQIKICFVPNSLEITWIATTNKNIFIQQSTSSTDYNVSFPSTMKPINNSRLQLYTFLSGGSTYPGSLYHSSLDIVNSQVVLKFDKPGLVFVTIILVNTERFLNTLNQIQTVSQSIKWMNQQQFFVSTIQNNNKFSLYTFIGVSQYYTSTNEWTWVFRNIFSDASNIGYSSNLPLNTIATIQFLQLEILVCGDNSSNVCDCLQGYYAFQGQCLQYNNTCFKQSQLYACDDCNTKFTGRNLINNQCICSSGQYDNGSMCSNCNQTCLECNGPQSTQCTLCNSTQRSLLNASCTCLIGYQDQNFICQVCDQTCSSCSGPYKENCSHCDSSLNRILNGTICQCKNKYYEDTVTKTCLACHSRCNNCNGPSSQECLSCNSDQNRSFTGNSCVCEMGFIEKSGKDDCTEFQPQQYPQSQDNQTATNNQTSQDNSTASNDQLSQDNQTATNNQTSQDNSTASNDQLSQDDQNATNHQLSQDNSTVKNLKLTKKFQSTYMNFKKKSLTSMSMLIQIFNNRNIAVHIGLFNLIIKAPQFILTQFYLNYEQPDVLFQLFRLLTVFNFPCFISNNQSQPNDTTLQQFDSEQFSDQAYMNPNKNRFRLLGLSKITVFTNLSQYIFLTVLSLIYFLLNLLKRGFKDKIVIFSKIQKIMIHFIHSVIEGNFLFLTTSQCVSFYFAVETFNKIDMNSMVSFILSFMFLGLYLCSLVKVTIQIIKFNQRKRQSQLMKESHDQIILLEAEFLQANDYYSLNYSLIIFPYRYRLVGYLDCIVQLLFCTYLICSSLIYYQFKSQQDSNGNALLLVYIVFAILFFDSLKFVTKLVISGQNYYRERQDKQRQIELAKMIEIKKSCQSLEPYVDLHESINRGQDSTPEINNYFSDNAEEEVFSVNIPFKDYICFKEIDEL